MYTATFSIGENILRPTTISLNAEMSVRELMEAAFIQLQTPAHPDPFKYTVQFFGYDYFQNDTSYLGYFITSIADKANNNANFWDLHVNGEESSLGIDSRLVKVNDVVELVWKDATAPTTSAAAKAHGRRSG